MKLIIGGSYAGKREYVKSRFGLTQADILNMRDILNVPGDLNRWEAFNAPDCSGLPQSVKAPGVLAVDAGEVIRQMEEKKCLLHLEEWVRALLMEKKEPLREVKELLKACPDGIFVMNEIGNGIVPMEREERIWREAVGRVGCFLAGCAGEVVRVVCGLPVQIKV